MGEKKEYFGKTDLIYLVNLISTELAKYVKAVDGKGLSTEDFTTALKTKLEGIDLSLYAPLNNAALTGSPTAPDSDKSDGTASRIATSGYVTRYVADAIKDITGIKFEKVTTLPATGQNGVIYLVPKSPTATSNIYTEYYWVAPEGTNPGYFEILGDTTVDLTNYITFDDLSEITTNDVQAAWDAKFPTA